MALFRGNTEKVWPSEIGSGVPNSVLTTGADGRVAWLPPGDGFNVRDFGAVGDGATDDTSAIQAALTAAHAIGGAGVAVPYGSYKVTGTLTVYGNTILSGDGWSSSLVFSGLSGANAVIFGGDDAAVEDLKITGTLSIGVFIGHSRNAVRRCNISGCTVPGPTGNIAGVHASTADDLLIEDNFFSGNGLVAHQGADIKVGGLGTGVSNRVQIVGNVCTSTLTYVGIECYDMASSTIARNSVANSVEQLAGNSGYGIMIYRTVSVGATDVHDNLVQGNLVKNCDGTGYYLQGNIRVSVIGNIALNTCITQDDTSLHVAGIAIPDATDSVVSNNIIKTSGKAGISLGGVTNNNDGCTVVGNTIEGCARPGIRIRNNVTRCTFGNNSIRNCDGGIVNTVASTIQDCAFTGNAIFPGTAVTRAGISLLGPVACSLVANTINGAQAEGIILVGGSDCSLLANVIRDASQKTNNTYSGIEINTTPNCSILGNVCINTGSVGFKYGVSCTSGADAVVAGNRVSGAKTADFHIISATPVFYGNAHSEAVLATGAAHTVDDVITALQVMALVKQS